jgi:hypothetical protein
MDMLVKLYDLPDSRPAFDRLRQAGITLRRALAPEKHKVVGDVQRGVGQRNRDRVQPPAGLLLYRD